MGRVRTSILFSHTARRRKTAPYADDTGHGACSSHTHKTVSDRDVCTLMSVNGPTTQRRVKKREYLEWRNLGARVPRNAVGLLRTRKYGEELR